MNFKVSFLILLMLSFSAGCQPKPIRRPVIGIEVLSTSNAIKYGDNIELLMTVNTFSQKLSSLTVFVDDIEVGKTSESTLKLSVSTEKLGVGNHTVKAIAVNDKQKKGLNNKQFLVVSDVVPKDMRYEVLSKLNHNHEYFTQGFEFHDGTLYEGTGLYGRSGLYAYNHKTGKIAKSLNLDERFFGEGITILNDKIFQITYKEKTGFVYNLKTFEKINEFTFESEEGWGLTTDGSLLIMSDGTSMLHFINPDTFERVKSIEVCDNNGAVDRINELEYVDGFIYANIWTTDYIIKIDAATGKVVAQADMKNLLDLSSNANEVDVLNGIAWNADEKAFYITGKLWPSMYKVIFSQAE